MPNVTTTPIDNGKVALEDIVPEDAVVTITGPKKLKAGTILARSVANPTKWLLFVVGGASDGNGVPGGIVPYDTVEKVDAGSGDVPLRVAVAGKFNFERLVVDAVGNNSTLTNVHLDTLRSKGIFVEKLKQLGG
jgi:hypothetical protein